MPGWRDWFARPPLAALREAAPPLRRALGAWSLFALGVGAVVGAGAFSVLGFAAAEAGPLVVVSIAAVAGACALVALCYAELATLLPVSGSSYSYALASMGPLPAWIVAWSIALSYVIGNGAVASSLSANLQGALAAAGVALPRALSAPPAAGGLVDAPALVAVLALTLLLARPVRESALQNAVLVAARGAILLVFVAAALLAPGRAPLPPIGGAGGAVAAAGLVFFSFLGFEVVGAAAQEARDPARSLPRAMLASVAVAALVYVALTLLLLALAPGAIATADPLGAALRARGLGSAAALVDLGGTLATLGVLLVYMLAASRIFLPLAPPWLARVHPRHGTPHRMTVAVGIATAASAALLPFPFLVSLTNDANLLFFALACLAVPLLRKAAPDAPRPFRAPAWAPWAGALACVALMGTLAPSVHLGFAAWVGLGLMAFAARRLAQ